MKTHAIATRSYGPQEEFAHAAMHALGAAASVAAITWLVVTAALYGDLWRLVGGLAFGVSTLLLLCASTLYHAARPGEGKRLYRKLDHSAIYLQIAGTYTAFTIGVMRGGWGWTLFATVWTLAFAGIVAELAGGLRSARWSAALYVALGWLGILCIRQLMASLTPWQLGWLLAGGLAYTAGVPFYVWKSRRYTHAVWHVFVLAGAACHFVAVQSAMHRP